MKNLLNFTPAANSTARPHDLFDKQGKFENDGHGLPSPINPYGLTFHAAQVHAPYQEIRAYINVWYTLNPN